MCLDKKIFKDKLSQRKIKKKKIPKKKSIKTICLRYFYEVIGALG